MSNFIFVLKVLFIIILFKIDLSFSEEKKQVSTSKSDNVKIFPAVVYSQRRIYHGALIWDAPVLIAGPGFVFYNKISLGNGGLSYFKNFLIYHHLSIGVNAFDDNEPNGPVISLKNQKEDYKNQRKATYFSYLKYEYKYKRDLELSVYYERDLGRHFGDYSLVKISNASLIPFLSFGSAVGIGSKSSNVYAYGPQAVSGIGHIDYFIGSFLPVLPKKGNLILNLTFSTITQKRNYEADYIRKKHRLNNLSIIGLWSF